MTDSSRRDFLRTLCIATAAAARPRLVAAQEVRVRTIAGTGVAGYEPEGAAGLVATTTPVDNPYGIVVGPDGALYFCEVDTGRTRRMDLGTSRLTTVSGNGEAAYSGDGGAALDASFSAPHEIRFDRGGHRGARCPRSASGGCSHRTRIYRGRHGRGRIFGRWRAGRERPAAPAAQSRVRRERRSAHLRHRQRTGASREHAEWHDLDALRHRREARRDPRCRAPRRHTAQGAAFARHRR